MALILVGGSVHVGYTLPINPLSGLAIIVLSSAINRNNRFMISMLKYFNCYSATIQATSPGAISKER